MVSRIGTENPAKDSREIIMSIGRIAKGTHFPALDRFGNREGIPTQQIDVVKEERRKPSNIFRLEGKPSVVSCCRAAAIYNVFESTM